MSKAETLAAAAQWRQSPQISAARPEETTHGGKAMERHRRTLDRHVGTTSEMTPRVLLRIAQERCHGLGPDLEFEEYA